MAEAPAGGRRGREDIHSAANGPGNKAAGPNFRYSARRREFIIPRAEGAAFRVTHVHFNAITASCCTAPGGTGKTTGELEQRAVRSTKDSLCADVSLFSEIFARCHHTPKPREYTLVSLHRCPVVREAPVLSG